MNTNHYQTFNLKSNASIEDIKKAYRNLAKENHPDLIGNDSLKINKFITIHKSYRELLKKHSNKLKEKHSLMVEETLQALKDKKQDYPKDSQHIIYLEKEPQLGDKLIITRKIKEICPVCFGEGKTLSKAYGSNLLKSKKCFRCNSIGFLAKEKKFRVNVTAEIKDKKKFILKKVGDYYPQKAYRSNLIVILKIELLK